MTTAPDTTVAAAVTWLYRQCALQPEITADGVHLFVGPMPRFRGHACVELATATPRDVEVLAMVGGSGPGWLQEVYEIEYRTWAQAGAGAGGQLAALQTVYGLVAAVERSVRADITLGGAVITAQPVKTDHEPSWDESGKGAVCVAAGSIQVQARL